MTTKRKVANSSAQDKTRADLKQVVTQVDSAISALRTVLGIPSARQAQVGQSKMLPTQRSVKKAEA